MAEENYVYDVRRYTYIDGRLEVLDVSRGFSNPSDATAYVLTLPGIENAEQQDIVADEVHAAWAKPITNDDGTEGLQEFVSIIRLDADALEE